MTDPRRPTAETPPEVSPFRFTLSTMFMVVIGVAIIMSGYATGPRWAIWLILILPMTTPFVLAVYSLSGDARVRAFCFGGMVPGVLGLLVVVVFIVPITLGLLMLNDPTADQEVVERGLVRLAIYTSSTYLVMVLMGGLLAMASRPAFRRLRRLMGKAPRGDSAGDGVNGA